MVVKTVVWRVDMKAVWRVGKMAAWRVVSMVGKTVEMRAVVMAV